MRKLLFTLGCLGITQCFYGQTDTCRSIINFSQLQVQAPDRFQQFMQLESNIANYIANQNNSNARLINLDGIIIIPVVVHVLHRGESVGTGRNISDAQIQSQIDVLNEDFRRLNADRVNTPSAFLPVAADYGFEFRLACLDPLGNSTTGITRTLTSNNSFTYFENSQGQPDETAIGVKVHGLEGLHGPQINI